jgi:hypothetical protein
MVELQLHVVQGVAGSLGKFRNLERGLLLSSPPEYPDTNKK